MKDTIELVKQLSTSAMLSFSDDELKAMASDLQQAIDLVSVIKNVDIPTAEVTKQTVPLGSFRKDTQEFSLSKEDALKNAPKTKSGNFEVAMVVE